MRLKVGETWTREKEEDDLRALFNSGNLLNVTIDTTDVPGGVNVVVTAEARPAMGDLVFQGNTVFKTERLRDEAEFKAGTVVDDTKLNEVRSKILELYTKRGSAETTVRLMGDWWKARRRGVMSEGWTRRWREGSGISSPLMKSTRGRTRPSRA
jgi:outer membrane protein assembly factor BamA